MKHLPPWSVPWMAYILAGGDGGSGSEDTSEIVRLALGSQALIVAFAQASGSTQLVIPGICAIAAMALAALVRRDRWPL